MFTTFGGSPGGPGGYGGPSTGRDAYSLFRTPAAAANNRAGGAVPPPPNTASRRLSLTRAGGPEALPPPPLAALHETTGGGDGTSVGGAANGVDAIIEELYAYASDPANYPSGGTGSSATPGRSGDAFEAFASQSPAQKRERFQRRLGTAHGALMRKMAELSSRLDNTGGGGGGGGDDGRFLTWVAATILNPDGAVARRALANGENVDSDDDADEAAPEAEEEAEKLLARRLGEALDGLAASVRGCLSDGEEAQPSRAMLRVLLERNGASASLSSGNDHNNNDGDLPLRSYLALPGRVRSALAGKGGSASNTSSSSHSKRRRLHLHGGGYAASSSSSGARTAKGSTTAVAETTVAAVLAYVLAEYLASASCPFFFVGSDDSTNGPPSPTWDLLRACTVHAASEMGLAAFLPAVRAGLVCYGLDRLADDAAAVGMVDMAVEEEEEEEDDDGGERRIIVEGLSPVAVVDLILSDSG